MRFDTPIFFQRIVQGEYDPATGNYEADQVTEAKRYANVTDAGSEVMNIVYGEIRIGCYVIRLQTRYTEPFDRIRIGSKTYHVDYKRDLTRMQAFVVSEVQ